METPIAGAVPEPDLQLEQVEIERFKAAFKPQPVTLGPLTVLIGRNGSGKSTLIEALQWLDTAVRQDVKTACERYWGPHDLMNLRSQADPPYFQFRLRWRPAMGPRIEYLLKVEEVVDGATARVAEERLRLGTKARGTLIRTDPTTRRRELLATDGAASEFFDEPDRLALARTGRASLPGGGGTAHARVQQFWRRAVFLRLSPNRLAQGSSPRRRSFEPLLDEEGQNLPALLKELTGEQKADLIRDIQQVLPDMQEVEVPVTQSLREERVFYYLKEKMPYRGRSGRSLFPIPAWMLSEGTRRITAILALLRHDPPPSLLCIEEIENGLDPWTTVEILRHLQSAADRGTQVILTTHSPWLLNHLPLEAILSVSRKEGTTLYERFSEMEAVRNYATSYPPGTLYAEFGA